MGVPEMKVLIVLIALFAQSYCQMHKLCAQKKHDEDCQQLSRSNQVECNTNYHNIDCILNIEQTKTDFGRVTPEEALIAANFVKNIVVLGEFRNEAIYDDSVHATVVLVRSNYTGGLKGLRGKKYCHPGFKFDEIASDLVLKEFELAVLKDNNAEGCENKVDSNTLLEKEVQALHNFFGPSCRPGPWIRLPKYDEGYYKKYSKLCELCTNKEKCIVESSAVPFMQSLECLINKGGDVTLTTINTVYEFFNKSENKNKQTEYSYLCRDGRTNSLDNPCIWTKQPWNLIIANKNKGDTIKNDLGNWLTDYIINSTVSPNVDRTFKENLQAILFPPESKNSKIYMLQQPTNLLDYMKSFRNVPTVQGSKKCNQDIKWCTVSDAEKSKCEWLAQASANIALQPVLNCVQNYSSVNCLETIKRGETDVVTSDAHFGYLARQKGLAPLAYPETHPRNIIQPIIVIKNTEQSITNFQTLKSKKSCFPEYAGIEWLTFINAAYDRGVLPKTSCDYGEIIDNFVGDSCMPGLRDQEHENSATVNVGKLCSLCHPATINGPGVTCNVDSSNKFYGNAGALKCLKEVGDFAVVTKGVYPEINELDYKVLCKNGSVALYPGFNVDDNCVLTSVIDSEVVSKRNNSKNTDLEVVLLNFELHFGAPRVKPFEVFNIFNGTLDLLFKDSTPGLAPLSSDNKFIKNYVNTFSHIDKCTNINDKGGSAAGLEVTIFTLISAFVLILFVNN